MKRVFCDGCDDDISVMLTNKSSVEVEIKQSGAALLLTPFDLCDSCRRRLVTNANPKQWARPAKPAAA